MPHIIVAEAEEKYQKLLKEFRSYLKDIRDNWDCDSGANETHPDYCRCCEADAKLKESE